MLSVVIEMCTKFSGRITVIEIITQFKESFIKDVILEVDLNEYTCAFLSIS